MTLLLTFLLMTLILGGMALGVLFGRRPISGSCGGMKTLGLDSDCEYCGGDPERCQAAQRNSGLS